MHLATAEEAKKEFEQILAFIPHGEKRAAALSNLINACDEGTIVGTCPDENPVAILANGLVVSPTKLRALAGLPETFTEGKLGIFTRRIRRGHRPQNSPEVASIVTWCDSALADMMGITSQPQIS